MKRSFNALLVETSNKATVVEKQNLLRCCVSMATVIKDEKTYREESQCSSAANQVHFKWLANLAPEFKMKGDNIRVLLHPQEFYSALTMQLQNANQRVSVASLYIGTGVLEQQLVNILQEKLQTSTKQLNIHILLDYMRGTRGIVNSRMMLLPLLNCDSAASVQHDVHIALYHTPDLRGIWKYCIPERWNEVIGVAHMKIFVVDNTVILSGANLSNDYFTNRQDRYVIFEDKNLADFFDSLVQTISSFSLQLQKNNSLQLNKSWNIHPFYGDYFAFKSEARKRIENLMHLWKFKAQTRFPDQSASFNHMDDKRLNCKTSGNSSAEDTTVYPLIQLGPFGIGYDATATELMLKSTPPGSRICLAAAYFNLTSRYMDLILHSSVANYDIITASPRANGFFTAKGVSGSIPKLYTHLAKLFFDSVNQQKQAERITLYEYERPSWTFHGKGLWLFLPNCNLPTISLIGSPNFGHRSVHRDLEAQVAIITENLQLQQQLHLEQQKLFLLSSPVCSHTFAQPERYVPFWVRLVARAFKNFF